MRVLLLVFLLSAPAFAGGAEVPTSAPLISDASIALLMPILASAIATAFNAWLRAQKRKGKRASPLTLAAGAALNTVALNLDQAKRQAQAAAAKGPKP